LHSLRNESLRLNQIFFIKNSKLAMQDKQQTKISKRKKHAKKAKQNQNQRCNQ
jgi:hypothetical protein